MKSEDQYRLVCDLPDSTGPGIFAPNPTIVAYICSNGTIRVLDTSTGKILYGTKSAAHRGSIIGLAISHDQKKLATLGLDATIVLWDLAGKIP